MVSFVPRPPTLPSAPVTARAESGMKEGAAREVWGWTREQAARRLRAASRQSGLGCVGMTSGASWAGPLFFFW